MKIEWFESSRLGERYCKIKLQDRPMLYVFPKKMSNTYALCAVRYGSVDRSYCISGGKQIILPDGIAHFLEHKMFTEEDGSDAFDKFSAFGADANAYTSYDRTVYLFNCTSNFESSFSTLLNMMTHPHFTDESVKKECGIIEQEILMYEDEPEAVCYENMLSALYREHPVRVNGCGTPESISQITPELLYGCYNTFYNPDNMVIVVCGNVDAQKIAGMVEAQEGWTKSLKFERCIANDFDQPYQKSIYRKMQREVVADAALRHRQDIIASILERMLFSTSADLYNELYDKGLITSPFSIGRTVEDTYAFTELCGTADNPESIVNYIVSHIEDKRTKGLSYDDFVRCKRRRVGDVVSRFDSTEEIANSLIDYAFDDLDILRDAEIVESIEFDEVVELFDKMYHEQNMAVSYIMPLK